MESGGGAITPGGSRPGLGRAAVILSLSSPAQTARSLSARREIRGSGLQLLTSRQSTPVRHRPGRKGERRHAAGDGAHPGPAARLLQECLSRFPGGCAAETRGSLLQECLSRFPGARIDSSFSSFLQSVGPRFLPISGTSGLVPVQVAQPAAGRGLVGPVPSLRSLSRFPRGSGPGQAPEFKRICTSEGFALTVRAQQRAQQCLSRLPVPLFGLSALGKCKTWMRHRAQKKRRSRCRDRLSKSPGSVRRLRPYLAGVAMKPLVYATKSPVVSSK